MISRHLLAAIALASLSLSARAVDLTETDKIAVLSGQSFDVWSWSGSGYLKLVRDELNQSGIKDPLSIVLENQKTAQMLERLDADVIAKKPAWVVIIPGVADYNAWTTSAVDPAFTKNLEDIIAKLQAANLKVVLVTSYGSNANQTLAITANVGPHNEAIRTLAQAHGVPLIDFVKVLDTEPKVVAYDGNLAAKALINQIFAAEILHLVGYDDQAIKACREQWLDLPNAIQFPPSVSVNTYEKLKAASKNSGGDVNGLMNGILHQSAP